MGVQYKDTHDLPRQSVPTSIFTGNRLIDVLQCGPSREPRVVHVPKVHLGSIPET